MSHKHWIFNPKASAIQVKLDALVAKGLARQNAQQARELDAAREAAALRQQAIKAALGEKWRVQAQRNSMLRQEEAQTVTGTQARAGRQELAPVHLPTLHYRLRDGGVLLRHEGGGGMLLVPENGNEAVLHAFAELSLQFSAERGGYRATKDQLENVLLALRPFQLAVKSV